jgi:hypothetical protein
MRMEVLQRTTPGAMTRDTGSGRTSKNREVRVTKAEEGMETRWKTGTTPTVIPLLTIYQEDCPT